MLQDSLVVVPLSKMYIVSTVFFHKYGGVNVSVMNCMSRFSIFVPTEATVKLDNGNMRHVQGIRIFVVVLLTVMIYI